MIDRIIDLVRNIVSWLVEHFAYIFVIIGLFFAYINGADKVKEWWSQNDWRSENYTCSAWAERTNEKGQTRKEAGLVNLTITKKKDAKDDYRQHLRIYSNLTINPGMDYGNTLMGDIVLTSSEKGEEWRGLSGSTTKTNYSLAFQKHSKVLALQVEVLLVEANGVIVMRDLSNITAYCGKASL